MIYREIFNFVVGLSEQINNIHQLFLLLKKNLLWFI